MSPDNKREPAQVVVARHAGVCWGVDRALDVVEAAVKHAGRRPVVTLGPIIHNPGVVASLEEKGVTCANPDAAPPGDAVAVVRAHGLSHERRQALSVLGDRLFDATCPFVARVQREVEEAGAAGRTAILVGDADHAEFRAARTYATGPLVVVGAPDEIDVLPPGTGPVTLIAQTTLDAATFDAVVARARVRFSDVAVRDTRCDDTRERQAEVEALAQPADWVIVVGGRNSANTARLASVAARSGAHVQLVESASDLDVSQLSDARSIAIVGGASTPRTDVDKVAETIRSGGPRQAPNESARRKQRD